MICIEAIFENGNRIITDINCTFEQASTYYVGNYFQFGDNEQHPEDLLVKCIAIKELKEN